VASWRGASATLVSLAALVVHLHHVSRTGRAPPPRQSSPRGPDASHVRYPAPVRCVGVMSRLSRWVGRGRCASSTSFGRTASFARSHAFGADGAVNALRPTERLQRAAQRARADCRCVLDCVCRSAQSWQPTRRPASCVSNREPSINRRSHGSRRSALGMGWRRGMDTFSSRVKETLFASLANKVTAAFRISRSVRSCYLAARASQLVPFVGRECLRP
jgi:hypothetical protein